MPPDDLLLAPGIVVTALFSTDNDISSVDLLGAGIVVTALFSLPPVDRLRAPGIVVLALLSIILVNTALLLIMTIYTPFCESAIEETKDNKIEINKQQHIIIYSTQSTLKYCMNYIKCTYDYHTKQQDALLS